MKDNYNSSSLAEKEIKENLNKLGVTINTSRDILEAKLNSAKLSSRYGVSKQQAKTNRIISSNRYVANNSVNQTDLASKLGVNNSKAKQVGEAVNNTKNTAKKAKKATETSKKAVEETKKTVKTTKTAVNTASTVASASVPYVAIAKEGIGVIRHEANYYRKKAKKGIEYVTKQNDNPNNNPFLDKISSKIPLFSKIDKLSDSEGKNKKENNKHHFLIRLTKSLTIFGVLLGLVVGLLCILVMFLPVILCIATPLGLYMGTTEYLRSDDKYISHFVDDRFSNFYGEIESFSSKNVYHGIPTNEVKWDTHIIGSNHEIVIATYQSIMCANMLNDDYNGEDIADDFLILDKSNEIDTFNTVFDQFNYYTIEDSKKTIKYIDREQKTITLSNNVVRMQPLSTSGGKDTSKYYYYDCDSGYYLKNIFGQYITDNNMSGCSYNSIAGTWQLKKLSDGEMHYVYVAPLNYSYEEDVEKEEEVNCQIMTVHVLNKQDWLFANGNKYNQNVIDYLNMMESSSNGFDNGAGNYGGMMIGGTPPAHYDDAKVESMMKVAYSYLGGRYVWGGKSPAEGMDCSGFVGWVIRTSGASDLAGATIHTDGLMESGYFDLFNDESQVRTGDIVWFWSGAGGRTGHIGIVVDPVNKIMIHCASSKLGCIEGSYASRAARGDVACYGRVK